MKKLSKQSFPSLRMRRLRSTNNIRRLVRETKLAPENLIQPIFLIEGKNKKEKISSMPDICRLTIDHALKEIKKLSNLDVLVINALRLESHPSHLNLIEAIEIIKAINPKKTFLTHISNQLGFHKEVSKKLPENIFLAYDGMEINL